MRGIAVVSGLCHCRQTLASMPLKIWRTDQVTPLTPHPSDPATMST
jgi:muconolactone delta-isomerase